MTAASRYIRALTKGLEWMTAGLFALLVLDVLWGVFSRHLLGSQSRWTEELARFLLMWVALLGAALVFRDRGHLGVDYVVGKLTPDARRVAEGLTHVAVFTFAALIMVGGGYRLVSETLSRNQLSPALRWKMGYVYSVIPMSGLFVSLFSLERLLGKPNLSGKTPN